MYKHKAVAGAYASRVGRMKGVAGYDGEDESSDGRSDLRAETVRGNSIYALLLEYG